MAKGFAIAAFKGDSLEVALTVRASGTLIKAVDYRFSLKVGGRDFAGEPSADGRRIVFRLSPAETSGFEAGEHPVQLVISGGDDYRKSVTGILTVGDPGAENAGFAEESVDFDLDVPPLSIDIATLVNLFPQECRDYLDGIASSASASAAAAGVSEIAAKLAENSAAASAASAVASKNSAAQYALDAQNAAASIVSAYVYGLDYDTTIATAASACKKVVLVSGFTYLTVSSFSQLPAHTFRRCVMDNLSTRHVNYYLHPENSNLKMDGSAANLTGTDGDVMVELPVTYWRIDTYTDGSGHLHRVYLVSASMFPNAAPHPYFYVSPGGATARTQYVGAFHNTLCDASGNRLAAMMNQAATSPATYVTGYRARSVSGCKPFTVAIISVSRTAASNNGGQGANSLFFQYLALMMSVEAGSFDTQTAFSPGFVNAASSPYSYTRLSGRTASLGNGTGSILYDAAGADADSLITWAAVADNQKVVAFSYRGIENPWGGIWQYEFGAVADTTNGWLYHTSDISLYSDTGYLTTYTKTAHAWTGTTGWVLTWNSQTLLPLTTGASSTTGSCDYFNVAAGTGLSINRGGQLSSLNTAGALAVRATTALADYPSGTGLRNAC